MSWLREAWFQLTAEPLQVLEHDLGLPMDEGLLQRLALLWQRRYGRDMIPTLVVHDALHHLLDAPPTPLGEGLVVRFQTLYGVFDRHPLGAVPAMVGGRVVSRSRRVREKLDGELSRRRPEMLRRLRAAARRGPVDAAAKATMLQVALSHDGLLYSGLKGTLEAHARFAPVVEALARREYERAGESLEQLLATWAPSTTAQQRDHGALNVWAWLLQRLHGAGDGG